MRYRWNDQNIRPMRTEDSNLSEAEEKALLSYAHCLGSGRIENAGEIVSLFRRLAKEGKAHAQATLGMMYCDGRWLNRDYAEGVNWLQKSAGQGHSYAQYNLGNLYRTGEGGEKDPAQAVTWFKKAAEQGDAYAQCNLGLMFANGEGVQEDFAEAVKWIRLAANGGSQSGLCWLSDPPTPHVQIFARILLLIERMLPLFPSASITVDTKLVQVIGNSPDLMELVVALETEFSIQIPDGNFDQRKELTLKDVVTSIFNLIHSRKE